jgi:hypothetical protein
MSQVGIENALGSRGTVSVVEARIGTAALDLLAGSTQALRAPGAVLVRGAQHASQVAPACSCPAADFARGAIEVVDAGSAAGNVNAYVLVAPLAGQTFVIGLADRATVDSLAGARLVVRALFTGLAFLVRLAWGRTRAGVTELVGPRGAVESRRALFIHPAGDRTEAILVRRLDAAVCQALAVLLARLTYRQLADAVHAQVPGIAIALLVSFVLAG